MNTILILFVLFVLIIFGIAYQEKLVKFEKKLWEGLKKCLYAIVNGLNVH